MRSKPLRALTIPSGELFISTCHLACTRRSLIKARACSIEVQRDQPPRIYLLLCVAKTKKPSRFFFPSGIISWLASAFPGAYFNQPTRSALARFVLESRRNKAKHKRRTPSVQQRTHSTSPQTDLSSFLNPSSQLACPLSICSPCTSTASILLRSQRQLGGLRVTSRLQGP